MNHLADFPALNQNHEDTQHLYPDVNAGMDCVPTCIAACLTWYTKQQYYGDEVIDSVYGPRYLGGTAAIQYINYCKQRGIKLWSIDGNPVQLVDAIKRELAVGVPCLLTVPGRWNDPNTSGSNPGSVTHVMVATGCDASNIEVMNPWNGQFEIYSDSWFHVKLCYNQIWPLESELSMIPSGPYEWYSVDNVEIPHGTTISQIAIMYGLTPIDIVNIPGSNLQGYNVDMPGVIDGLLIKLPGYKKASSQSIDVAAIRADLQNALSKLV